MRLPVVWFRFHDAGGEMWTVFLSTRATSAPLRKDKYGGPYAGKALFRTRRIYIELRQPIEELFDTVLHELTHVALRPLMLPSVIDEEIVKSVAEGLWPVLADIPVAWPALPEPLKRYVKE